MVLVLEMFIGYYVVGLIFCVWSHFFVVLKYEPSFLSQYKNWVKILYLLGVSVVWIALFPRVLEDLIDMYGRKENIDD